MQGVLVSVTPRDELHMGDEFVRRGGAVFPPARVVCPHGRQPFGQQESLTDELQNDADPQAVQLIKNAFATVKSLLMGDEQRVVRAVGDGVKTAAKRVLGASTDDPRDAMDKEWDVETAQNAHPIRSMSWHPNLSVIAVAQSDGLVALYDVKTAKWDERVLKHEGQADIGAIAWAPFSGGTLAVACRGGIFLWKVQISSPHEAPVLLNVFKHPEGHAFSGLSWNADGSLLAAFAKQSSSVCVVDVIYSRTTQLACRYHATALHWSPTGEYLFATTDGQTSFMWETCTWKQEAWDVDASACSWSSNGRSLVLALRNNDKLYPYTFTASPPAMDAQISAPAIDFSTKANPTLDGQSTELIGGRVREMAWDPTGKRIAVIFSPAKSDDASGRVIAIFSVDWKPFLIFTRRHASFASSFTRGALLSVAWSTGLVTFTPFYFHNETASYDMSVPPRIQCKTGCGDVGDPELDFLCIDCHADKNEQEQLASLERFLKEPTHKPTKKEAAAAAAAAASRPASRRGPPSVDHKRALEDFLNRTREKDERIVARENVFLEREMQIRKGSKAQLRKYMIATDEDEPVDPKEWSRYKYGTPRDIPRNDVDEETERRAQMMLYCYWRRRTIRKRTDTKRKFRSPTAKASKASMSPTKRLSTMVTQRFGKMSLSDAGVAAAKDIESLASFGKSKMEGWKSMSANEKRTKVLGLLGKAKASNVHIE
ncbi:TPA: hypothetical protein N0F65_001321 [Lagenidium giganteum]|uniref:A20-type domain-containing protein n=1 Tax=Lagenidium giganteum TaxID=4803 RepID=A0AAV2YYM9_9STRA|nr:TPA: hypothetical protein N0F65_001321 [Lagenidium giganteum]